MSMVLPRSAFTALTFSENHALSPFPARYSACIASWNRRSYIVPCCLSDTELIVDASSYERLLSSHKMEWACRIWRMSASEGIAVGAQSSPAAWLTFSAASSSCGLRIEGMDSTTRRSAVPSVVSFASVASRSERRRVRSRLKQGVVRLTLYWDRMTASSFSDLSLSASSYEKRMRYLGKRHSI